MTEYMRWLEAERGLSFDGYDELWRWSVDDLEGFWSSIWDFFEVQADGGFDQVLGSREMPGAEWFAGTRLNYAEHVFAGKDDAEAAILHASELRELSELSWGELRAQVAGDRRRPARARASSAATASSPTCRTSPRRSSPSSPPPSIGAIWSSCSPDFGPASVIDRFAQIEPKVLFAVDGYRYGGKDFDRREVVAELQAAMPSLERTVVLPYLDPDPDLSRRCERRDALGRAARRRRGRRARLRARPLRPPALGPLLLRHDRPAEGDRPGPGRDPARAPEEAPPPRRRPPRRPPLLVHDDRLDDVELPRLRPADPRRDRPLRRQPRPSRHGRALGPRRASRRSPCSAPAPPTSPPA